MPDKWAIAREFSRQLHGLLGDDCMDELCKRNDMEEADGICHTHDFCDANQCMIDALAALGLEDYGPNEDVRVDAIVSQAWSLAKEMSFDQEQINEDENYTKGMRG